LAYSIDFPSEYYRPNKMNEQKKDLIAILFIIFAAFSVYMNTLPNVFLFDDRHMIVDNNYTKHLATLPMVFKNKISSAPVGWGMYRPVLMLTFAFNYFFSGLAPAGYHLINILIHFLNAWLLYLFLKLFFKELSFPLRLGITLIFCVHPVNTEAVAYISSRSTILCSFFILSSLYTYIRWHSSQKKYLYLSSLACYALALLTKESGLVLVALLSAYEFACVKDLKKTALRLLPFILVTFGYLILIKCLFGGVFGLFSKNVVAPPPRPFFSNILIQSAVSLFYLYLFFYPFNLSIDHNYMFTNAFSNTLGFACMGLLAALFITALFLRKRSGILSFSILWYFIILMPQFYARLNIVAAEHHPYLAFFSVYFICGYAVSKWKVRQLYSRQFFLFTFLLFYILTVVRNFEWRNEYLLWRSALRVNPHSDLAKGSLALYLINRGFFAEGEKYLTEAASCKTQVALQPSLLNLATYYALFKKQPQKGLEVINRNREYLWKMDPLGYCKSLGLIYLTMGKAKEAREVWEKALQIYPVSPEINSNLGWWYLEQAADRKKAKEYFKEALKNDPDLILARLGLAAALEAEEPGLAVKEYKRVIKLAPKDSNAYYRLGLLYAKDLLSTQAEWYFKKTIELSPKFAPTYYNLCIFYLSLPQPDYQRAQEYFDKAKQLGFKVDRQIGDILAKREGIPPS
jgi:tetratricopeptide (TPR) repeat protein